MIGAFSQLVQSARKALAILSSLLAGQPLISERYHRPVASRVVQKKSYPNHFAVLVRVALPSHLVLPATFVLAVLVELVALAAGLAEYSASQLAAGSAAGC
jgi:hypothetical protein